MPKEESMKPSIEDTLSLKLKQLLEHLGYAFLMEGSKLPIIVSSTLLNDQKAKLFEIMRSRQRAIAWKIIDIKGISPSFCTRKILMVEEFKSVVQPQRHLNPNMKEVVKKEDKAKDWLYYLPSSSITTWNEMKRLFLDKFFPATRAANIRKEICCITQFTGETLYEYWKRFKQLCAKCPHHQISPQLLIQYFYEGLLPMDRSMIDAASGGALVDKMPEEAKQLISNMAENSQQFGTRADGATRRVNEVLVRCDETNLVLNWEKCHFMVQEGIVLGHKISSKGFEVDRAKIETIEKLSPPPSVKAIRSFLGHAGFYRRFIKDFSKIARPLTRLLEKDVDFIFDEECIIAFTSLKAKLVNAPIMVALD
ncbi:uncharacterized protein LOC125370429 [Ricinus communis]|uniref:uncharacterized protein LOC125370429 n=1 Tax=Ricinus communis TaxID=3988 RepID=UPI00201AB5A2|nr:uncharacterized protein LOC125370429 [Ricinus communis]